MAGVNLLDKIKREKSIEVEDEKGASLKLKLRSGAGLSGDNKKDIVLFVVGIGILWGSQFYIDSYTDRLTNEQEQVLASVDAQIQRERRRATELRELREEADRYQTRINALRAKLAKVESLSQNRNYLVRAVDFVVQEMPSTIWIRTVNLSLVSDQTLTLSGRALSMQVVGDYMQKLQPGSFFTAWNLVETRAEEPSAENVDDVQRVPPDSKSFQITARVEGPR